MPELLLKIGSVSANPVHYQDGDVIAAFTDRRINHVHAEHICDVRKAGFTAEGLRPDGDISERYKALTSQFKFERMNKISVRRTNLRTNVSDILSNTPNSKGERINITEYLSRRLKHPAHSIFGALGSEVWYAGKKFFSDLDLSTIWAMIEANSIFKRANAFAWPIGIQEIKSHLILRIKNLSELDAAEMSKPDILYRGEKQAPIPQAKRRYKIRWQDLGIGRSVEAVRDKTRSIDVRPLKTHDIAAFTSVRAKRGNN